MVVLTSLQELSKSLLYRLDVSSVRFDRLLYRLHDCIGFYNCLHDHLFDCLAGIHLEHRLLDRHLD